MALKSRPMKQGEKEAKIILEKKGFRFNPNYHDDNSCEAMPDLQYEDGRFLEVTHTLHNNAIANHLTKFQEKSIDEQLKIQKQVSEALDRLLKTGYSHLTDGMTQYQKDSHLIRSHLGYDVKDCMRPPSEFNCDLPIISCSIDNILREVYAKSKKHNKGDTDLFIFVLEDEFRVLIDLLKTGSWNGSCSRFLRDILKSPFNNLYVCTWDFRGQKYQESPEMLRFTHLENGKLGIDRL